MDSWDERTYVWKKDDSFAAVSQGAYNSEDYAAALEMYNRNHPRASATLRSKGAVSEGEKIYIPPSSILEKRHADAIARGKPRPVSSVPPAGEPGPVQAQYRNPPPAAPPPLPGPGSRIRFDAVLRTAAKRPRLPSPGRRFCAFPPNYH